jgi:hypothetical protein
MPSIVTPIPIAELPQWSTDALLRLRSKLLACENSHTESDVYSEDVDREIGPSKIRFKDDPRWNEIYTAVKAELAKREHVPSGGEIRREKANMKKTHERRRRK